MICKLSKISHHRLALIIVTAMFTLMHGCNSDNYSAQDSQPAKRIIEIRVDEDDQLWHCVIKGDQQLAFSAINNVSPTGLSLYFPRTTLDISEADLADPPNEIIEFIKADMFVDGNLANTRVVIGLDVARPYRIAPDENGFRISFPKVLDQPPEGVAANESQDPQTVATGKAEFSPGRVLKRVATTPMPTYIIVNLYADGSIMDYQSFAIDNPPRIVFDLFNLRSSHKEGRTIEVGSKWVKRIRYNAYPDKVRLVLDTDKQFLTQHFSFGTAAGLLIYVGQKPE